MAALKGTPSFAPRNCLFSSPAEEVAQVSWNGGSPWISIDPKCHADRHVDRRTKISVTESSFLCSDVSDRLTFPCMGPDFSSCVWRCQYLSDYVTADTSPLAFLRSVLAQAFTIWRSWDVFTVRTPMCRLSAWQSWYQSLHTWALSQGLKVFYAY